jgi:hypothetical protein
MKNKLYTSVLIASVIAIAVLATPVSTYAQQRQQQPKNFVATLTGKDE